MNRLAKIFCFVVFAVLTLAVVAGCSVDVLPSEDGGGTTARDGATGDDVSPGDDADVGDDDDGSTTVDDDTDPTRDGGGNPDDVDDDVTPGDDDVGEDGGRVENEDGGPATVPVDEEGYADLGQSCRPGQIINPELVIDIDVWGDDEFWPQVENQLIPPHDQMGLGPPGTPGHYEIRGPTTRLSQDPQLRIDSTPYRILNHSPRPIRISSFKIYRTEDELGYPQDLVWEQSGGYPEIGPGQMIDLCLIEKQSENYVLTPLCLVRLQEIH